MVIRSLSRSLLAIFMLAMICEVRAAESNFFKYTPDSGEKLAADKLYPQGRIFPFSGYSPHPRDYKKLLSSGFTALGPVYGKFDEFLKKCDDLKVKCMYQVQPYVDGKKLTKKEHLYKSEYKPDWEQITSSIKTIIKKHCSNKNIDWWVLAPEELRYWRNNEYEYLKRAVKAIHEADPRKRPVYMYSPGHRSGKSLSHVTKYLDIIGKGCYTNNSSQKNSRIWVRWTVEQELDAIKIAGRKNVVPILLPEMFQEPKAEELKMIPAWVRHDTYLGLVSGAKGVIIFSLWPRRKFPSHPIYLNAYCKVASEINGKPELGKIFLFGKAKKDLKMKIVSGPQTVSCKMRIRKVKTFTYPSITFANIAYKNARYLIAVNSSKQNIEAQFSGFPAETAAFDAVSGKASAAPVNGSLKLKR
eukprot:gnl/Carplike_NY0171/2827_a3795_428.p1 GENE.gnl/Carplike_NY0171/2827_a3795_428~~gnl/Carplike_NY0171/2827_a3795_428.p1  ORF type:complete len:414 (-),score=-6.77 gnl/Carplike_NY0171/2827_a3795_428:23-1264(-)